MDNHPDEATIDAVGRLTEALETTERARGHQYSFPFRDTQRRVRDLLMGGRRHLHEANMKEERRTHGHPHHTAEPGQSV